MPRIKSSINPHPVDVHVGQKVRERRILLGMSQQKLGAALDITFQQIQKYEKGTNRIGCSRLFEMCQVLDVPVSYFFDGYSRKPGKDTDAGLGTRTLRLARYFNELSDAHRDAVYDLVKTLSESDDTRTPKPRKRAARG